MVDQEKAIVDLLTVRRIINRMKFCIDDMNNLACAKTAVDYIDKAVNAYNEQNKDVNPDDNG